jgi:hypothetical protein
VPRAAVGAGVEIKEKEKDTEEEERECGVLELPVENLLHILQILQNKHDILAASNTCTALASIIAEYCLLERQQSIICFHSKRTHEEDVLGVGIALEHFHNNPGRIRAIRSPLDVLSHRAFTEDGVRMSVWKEPFSEFLPLVISGEHFGRARELILSSLANIAGEGAHPRWQRDLGEQA